MDYQGLKNLLQKFKKRGGEKEWIAKNLTTSLAGVRNLGKSVCIFSQVT